MADEERAKELNVLKLADEASGKGRQGTGLRYKTALASKREALETRERSAGESLSDGPAREVGNEKYTDSASEEMSFE